mgnify:FL=1
MAENPGEYGCSRKSCIFKAVLFLHLLIIIIPTISVPAVGLDIPGDLEIEIENSESDQEKMGPIGSTFTFSVENPSVVPKEEMGCTLLVDGEKTNMTWDDTSLRWRADFMPPREGIFEYVVKLYEKGNDTNSVSEGGTIAVYSPTAGSDGDRSEHDYHNDPMTYLVFSFVMTFGAVSIMAGLFALKYGRKRSKITAIPMVLSGVVIWTLWMVFNFVLRLDYPDDSIFGIIHWVAAPLLKPFMALIGILLGTLLSIFIFLTVIVRT